MTRTTFDRLWDDKVQAERLRQGSERATKKRELALARRALQDRYEPCPGVVRSVVGNGERSTHPSHCWTVSWRDETEECIFCGLRRPAIGERVSFDPAVSNGRILSATEIQERYRDGNIRIAPTLTDAQLAALYPPPTKGANE